MTSPQNHQKPHLFKAQNRRHWVLSQGRRGSKLWRAGPIYLGLGNCKPFGLSPQHLRRLSPRGSLLAWLLKRPGSRARPGSPIIEEIPSSSEGSPIRDPAHAAEHAASPVLASEQASTENSPTHAPAPRPAPKRKAVAQSTPATQSPVEPSAKRPKPEVAPSAKLEKF